MNITNVDFSGNTSDTIVAITVTGLIPFSDSIEYLFKASASKNTQKVHEAKSVRITRTYHVRTIDNEYRPTLGCWVHEGATSEGDMLDELPVENSLIIKAAENFLRNTVKQEATQYHINLNTIYLIQKRAVVEVVQLLPDYISKTVTPNEREFSEPIAEFKTKTEALLHLEQLVAEGKATKNLKH